MQGLLLWAQREINIAFNKSSWQEVTLHTLGTVEVQKELSMGKDAMLLMCGHLAPPSKTQQFSILEKPVSVVTSPRKGNVGKWTVCCPFLWTVPIFAGRFLHMCLWQVTTTATCYLMRSVLSHTFSTSEFLMSVDCLLGHLAINEASTETHGLQVGLRSERGTISSRCWFKAPQSVFSLTFLHTCLSSTNTQKSLQLPSDTNAQVNVTHKLNFCSFFGVSKFPSFRH